MQAEIIFNQDFLTSKGFSYWKTDGNTSVYQYFNKPLFIFIDKGANSGYTVIDDKTYHLYQRTDLDVVVSIYNRQFAQKEPGDLLYKHRLADRFLALISDFKLIDKNLVLLMHTSDVEELGKAIKPVCLQWNEMLEKRSVMKQIIIERRESIKRLQSDKSVKNRKI